MTMVVTFDLSAFCKQKHMTVQCCYRKCNLNIGESVYLGHLVLQASPDLKSP